MPEDTDLENSLYPAGVQVFDREAVGSVVIIPPGVQLEQADLLTSLGALKEQNEKLQADFGELKTQNEELQKKFDETVDTERAAFIDEIIANKREAKEILTDDEETKTREQFSSFQPDQLRVVLSERAKPAKLADPADPKAGGTDASVDEKALEMEEKRKELFGHKESLNKGGE